MGAAHSADGFMATQNGQVRALEVLLAPGVLFPPNALAAVQSRLPLAGDGPAPREGKSQELAQRLRGEAPPFVAAALTTEA